MGKSSEVMDRTVEEKAKRRKTDAEEYSRWIAERMGITVEEHLRRRAIEKQTRDEIQKEEGLDEDD